MDTGPGIKGEEEGTGFFAVIEGIEVVEAIGGFDGDLRVFGFEPVADGVEFSGDAAGNDGEVLAVEIFGLEQGFVDQWMVARQGDTDVVVAEWEIGGAVHHQKYVTEVLPLDGLQHALERQTDPNDPMVKFVIKP